MNPPAGLRVLILSDRQQIGLGWAEMLRPIAEVVWLGWEPLPPDARPDVIVADAAAEVADWDYGILRVGGARPESDSRDSGDLELPADVTARELQLACRLMARISRLWRQLDAEAASRCQLRNEALTDPLTGLPNRRAWDEMLHRWVDRVLPKQPGSGIPPSLCLAIFDLDHFKQINDAQGHAVGDEVLRRSGKAIVDSLRQGDFVARLGGDEFGLLIVVPDEMAAGAVVERVRAALPSRLAENSLPAVTASAGYCVAPADGTFSPDALYAAADDALRSAKQQGRHRTAGENTIR